MPESPRWLMNHGYADEAARVVRDNFGRDVALPCARPRRRRLAALAAAAVAGMAPANARGCAFLPVRSFLLCGGHLRVQVMSAMNLRSGYSAVSFTTCRSGRRGGRTDRRRSLSRRSFLIGSFGIAAGTCSPVRVEQHTAACDDHSVRGIRRCPIGGLQPGLRLSARTLSDRPAGFGHRAGDRGEPNRFAISTFLLPIIVAAYGVRTALGACVASSQSAP